MRKLRTSWLNTRFIVFSHEVLVGQRKVTSFGDTRRSPSSKRTVR